MNPHEAIPPDLPGPVFAAPWQAHAFALAVALSRAGHFTWTEWTEALGAEIAVAKPADDGSRYYELWLAALERVLTAKGLADAVSLADRIRAWDAAYRATPHGQPVQLAAGAGADA